MVDRNAHYRAGEDAPVEPGVYRVVGSDAEAVTLLRVVEDGRRVNSGVVVHLSRGDLDALAPADDPDAGLGRLRQAPAALAAHPLVSGAALVALVAGLALVAVGDPADARGGVVLVASGATVPYLLVR